jgi:hypothetical protein
MSRSPLLPNQNDIDIINHVTVRKKERLRKVRGQPSFAETRVVGEVALEQVFLRVPSIFPL